MAKTKVIIKLEDHNSGDISGLIAKLENKGMLIENHLPMLNRVIGTVEESKITELEQITGVAKVRKEKTFNIQNKSTE